MPIPSMKSLGIKKETPILIEELQIQHNEEVALLREQHADQIAELQKQLFKTNLEIESLTDEHTDILSPLPDPSESVTRKYVNKNGKTKKPNRKLMKEKSAVSIAADLKVKHEKEMEKVRLLENEIQKYRFTDDKENVGNVTFKYKKEINALYQQVIELKMQVKKQQKAGACEGSDTIKNSLLALERARKSAAITIEDTDKFCNEMQDFILQMRFKCSLPRH